MSWVAVAVGGGTLLTGVAGNIGKNKRAEKQAKGIEKMADRTIGKLTGYTGTERGNVRDSIGQIQSLADVFGQQANTSYLDTTEGASFSSMIDDRSKKNKNKLREDMNLMGGTHEAYLAGLGRINEQEGASFRDLVAGSDQRRAQLRGAQSGLLSRVLSGQEGLLQNKTNIAQSAYGMGANMHNQSQARNDAMMNNVNGAFQNAGMAALYGG